MSKKSPTGPTERTPQPEYFNSSSNLLRGPLVRSDSIFGGIWDVLFLMIFTSKDIFLDSTNISVEAPYPQGRLEITRLEAAQYNCRIPPFKKDQVIQYMDISENRGTPYPQIIHFNRVFHYKSSILEYLYFWKHPYIYIYIQIGFNVWRSLRESVSYSNTFQKNTKARFEINIGICLGLLKFVQRFDLDATF